MPATLTRMEDIKRIFRNGAQLANFRSLMKMFNFLTASLSGGFTSASSAAAVSVDLGFRPSSVRLVSNSGGTNPDVYIAHDVKTAGDNILITGSTGVITRVADASSIAITDTGFTVAAAAQTNSGRNLWTVSR